ncbi:MAG: hypothetical protein MJY51_00340 [Bacteroidales bacterium]|nr:hypothetical protein [Bacteroidales bacterium]
MKKIIFISAAVAVLCSCAKEANFSASVPGDLRQVTIDVESVDDVTDPDESKAWFSYVNGLYKFKWVNNETVGAFDSKADKDGGHEFKASNKDNNKATLTGTICPDATGRVVFLCPQQSNTYTAKSNNYKTNVSGNKITSVEIPYKTGFKKNFMDGRAALRIGIISDASKIETEKLNMYNPLAAIRFSFKNCSDEHPITNIEVFGNNSEQIAGFCDIDFTDPKNPKPVFNASPFLASGAQKVAYDLYLVPKEPATYTDGEYAAALAPTTFSKGLTFKFIDSKGNVAYLSSSKALTIGRNHIKNMGTFDVSKLDWHYGVTLHFMDVPFLRLDLPFTNTSNTFTAGASNIRNFKLQDGSGQEVKFDINLVSGGSAGRYDVGFEVKGLGSYIEIPAIEGKVLNTIFLRVSSTGDDDGQPCIVRASDGKYLAADGSFVADVANADVWKGTFREKDSKWIVNFGQYKKWEGSFAAGEKYRIQMTNGANPCRIKDIVLLYDDATKASSLASAPQVNDWGAGADTGALMY